MFCCARASGCVLAGFAVLAVVLMGGPGSARAQDRTLTFKQMHTGETATITYRRGGRYDPAGLKQINHMFRDWRRDEPTEIDPRLLDILWEVYRASGSRAAVQILSGYRSPVTNAALRSRSSGVADNSQHMAGKALDFSLPDVPTARLREVALRVQGGGVGFYSSSGFVHIDTGSVRHWPRMTRQQLANVFPDGKTVHIPSDGKPLPGYEVAKAEISRARSAPTAMASAGSSGRGLLAGLFNFGGNRQTPTATPAQTTAAPQVIAAASTTAPAASQAAAPQPQEPPAAAQAPAPVIAMVAPVPEPRPAAIPGAVPADVPLPAEATIQMASLPAGALPRERPLQTASLPRAGAALSPGAMEALIALAPSSGIADRLPFSATFTEPGEVVASAPEFVALDHSQEALRLFMSPDSCLTGEMLASLHHPDQTDIGSMLSYADAAVTDQFAPRQTIYSVGGFSGPAVAPLPARTYRSAWLTGTKFFH